MIRYVKVNYIPAGKDRRRSRWAIPLTNIENLRRFISCDKFGHVKPNFDMLILANDEDANTNTVSPAATRAR